MLSFAQSKFIAILRQNISEPDQLNQYLQDNLNLNYQAARRRISGDAALSLDELSTLMHLCPAIIGPTLGLLGIKDLLTTNLYCFTNEDEFMQYLQKIRTMMSEAVASGEAKLRYVARDLPLYLYLRDEVMLNYKFGYWTNTLSGDQFPVLRANTHRVARELYDLFLSIDSEELWRTGLVKEHNHQLLHAFEAGYINEARYLQLQSATASILSRAGSWTRTECKSTGTYCLRHVNPLTMYNGGYLCTKTNEQIFGAFSRAQFLASTDPITIRIFNSDFEYHWKVAQPVTHASPSHLNTWLQTELAVGS